MKSWVALLRKLKAYRMGSTSPAVLVSRYASKSFTKRSDDTSVRLIDFRKRTKCAGSGRRSNRLESKSNSLVDSDRRRSSGVSNDKPCASALKLALSACCLSFDVMNVPFHLSDVPCYGYQPIAACTFQHVPKIG